MVTGEVVIRLLLEGPIKVMTMMTMMTTMAMMTMMTMMTKMVTMMDLGALRLLHKGLVQVSESCLGTALAEEILRLPEKEPLFFILIECQNLASLCTYFNVQ